MLSDIARLLDDDQQLRTWAKGTFDSHDAEKKGSIDRAELFSVIQEALQALSTDPSLPIEDVLHEIALEGDGPVDFEEYVRKVQDALKKLVQDKKAEEVPIAHELEAPYIEEVAEPVVEEVSEEVSAEVREQRLKSVSRFEQYVETSGIAKVFQIIFAEIITKKIESGSVFAYTAMRLRQIGKELSPFLPTHLAAPQQPSDSP